MVSNQSPSISERNSHAEQAVLPAREVHHRLKRALAELQRAERNAVLWFAEMVRRKLYKELGYSSIHQYAELELGFSMSKTSQFLRLAESLEHLPKLRKSLARGDIPWTKAREVATVATSKTEAKWIREAKKTPRRVLEKRVKETRRLARAGSLGCEQPSLEMGAEGADLALSLGEATNGEPRPGATHGDLGVDPATPVSLHLRMTAEQYARYQALLDTLRKQKAGSDAVEMVLAGLEQMAVERSARSERGAVRGTVRANAERGARGKLSGAGPMGAAEFPRGKSEPGAQPSRAHADRPAEFPRGKSKYTRSPYQVIVQKCPSCNKGTLPTTRGEKTLTPKELRTILCDARIRANGKRNTAPIPERIRRAVMERDRYRCRAAGCGRTSFLAVHHLVPREANGPNAMDNLITLCSGCHGALHDHA